MGVEGDVADNGIELRQRNDKAIGRTRFHADDLADLRAGLQRRPWAWGASGPQRDCPVGLNAGCP